MAQVSVSAVNISERKRVQELVINGDELPPRYIHKAGDYGDVDISPPFMDIPIIDLQSLLASDKQELHKLHSALNLWGCFQVTKRGLTPFFLHVLLKMHLYNIDFLCTLTKTYGTYV